MQPQVYKRRMDGIIQSINDGFFRDAARRLSDLVRDSNVRRETVEMQLKHALFQEHGPKVDKIWTNLSVAVQDQAA
jgi:hypothetical protein